MRFFEEIAKRTVMPAIAGVTFGLLQTTAAAAGEPMNETDDWTYRISPYVWAAALSGTVSTFPSLPTADVDASFSDIIGNADFALMLNGEARRGDIGIIVDSMYVDLSAKGTTPGPLFSSVKLENTVFMGSLSGAYRIYNQSDVKIDLMGGARVWSIENALTLRAGLLNERSGSDSETWVDPLIGLRVHSELDNGFYLRAYGDIGGIAIGSDLSWQILGTAGYAFSDRFSAELGYRHLAIDYDRGGFLYDVSFSGPIIGANLRF